MNPLYTSISDPFRFKNLEIFFLRGPETFPGRSFLPLHEALERQQVIVHETGNVGELEVENLSDLDVFIQAGDVVKGGRQDRTLGVDVVVAAQGGRVPVPAFCVESRRWHKRKNESERVFSKSDSVLASRTLRLSAKLTADQSEVWKNIESFQATIGRALTADVHSKVSPSSYQLSMEHEELQKRKRAYFEALESTLSGFNDAVGFAFAINGKPSSADVYGSCDLFRRLWVRQLDLAVIEALMEAPAQEATEEPAMGKEGISRWLEHSASASTHVPEVREVCPDVWVRTSKSAKSALFDTVLGGEVGPVLHRNIISMH